MAEGKGYYGTGFEHPENVVQVKKSRSKKRALQDRFFEESPSKKTKRTPKKPVRRPFGAQPPPPNDDTNEDSSLMDLVNLKHPPGTFKLSFASTSGDKTPSKLSTSLSPCSTASSMSPVRHSMSNISCNSPTSVYYNSIQVHQSDGNFSPSFLQSLQTTPQIANRKRQKLTPAPSTSSPSWSNANGTPTKPGLFGSLKASSRVKLEDKFAAAEKDKWNENPCLDWSLKTRLTLISNKPFGWNSTSLKSSEESSGTSAFARCIDIDPVNKGRAGVSPQGSQLDTSLGAQFHQCCLYWQHPCLPSVNFFPRDINYLNLGSLSPSPLNGVRLEEKVMDCMLMEWIEAFRSVFQLLRTRQCPYFYICANQFTGLFCAAGTQGLDYLQVYITPSSKGFRDALKTEGIEFAMPFYTPDESSEKNDGPSRKRNTSISSDKDGESDDEGADQWLNEMGISQDLSLSTNVKSSPVSAAEEKNKSTLVSIAGNDTLAFFNFLINSRSFLVATAGPFAGLPPTILSPAAFHGATLKTLKVKQAKVKNASGDTTFSIQMNGPILPHVIASLCSLLQNTVKEFKIQTSTLASTVNLNLNSQEKSPTEKIIKANAFELQNLSDCGLKKSILDLFCRPDSIATINDLIECRNSMYKWS